jgi:hypothetical protein
MSTKTTHIVPSDGGWTVRKEGEPRKKNGLAFIEGISERTSSIYPTQKEAIDAARAMVQRSSQSQIVVHNRDGSMRWRDVHGLPEVQTPPHKSELGTKAIQRAVSTVIRERLEKR